MSEPDRLAFALELAREAGRIAAAHRVSGDLAVSEKSANDFVTNADRAVESFIRECVAATYPSDSILGEEGGGPSILDGLWVVDPIDGTSNYWRGFAEWGVSIAYVDKGEIQLGVIDQPAVGLTYSASRGGGAFCNGEPIAASRRTRIDQSLALVGTYSSRNLSEGFALMRELSEARVETRALGAAAPSLLHLAAGHAEAYFEPKLHAWDALAGILIAEEAGATCNYPALADFLVRPGPVAAWTPVMSELIRRQAPDWWNQPAEPSASAP